MGSRGLLGVLAVGVMVVAGAACRTAHAPPSRSEPIDDQVLEDLPCTGARPPAEPDLIGLDSSARAALDAARQQGIIVVHYKGHGCDIRLDVLPNCVAGGGYTFSPYAASESKVAHGLAELYTDMPLGASRLSSRMKDASALRADTLLVGIQGIKLPAAFHPEDLKGDCAGATHVVSKIYVGAFALATGDAHSLEGRGPLFGATPPGTPPIMQREGNPKACEEAQEKRAENSACNVPLRLGLLPITACTEDGGKCPPAIAAVDAGPPPSGDAGGAIPAMVHVAGGSFTMGAKTRVTLANDPMRRTVTVGAFDIDTNLVTVADYTHCVEEGMCTAAATDQPTCNYGHADRAKHPINCVDYTQAAKYCHAVNKRLPAEEEWEFAARGGAEERTYPWGNAEPAGQLCWSGIAKKDSTCPVGSFPAGAFGLFDMAGNVWEWTSSVFSPEKKEAQVCRGGGWSDARALDFRGAYRDAHAPKNKDSDLGFRCVRSGS